MHMEILLARYDVRPFDYYPRTRVVFGDGALERLGELARELGFTRSLIVSDPGIVAAGLVGRATASLRSEGIDARVFDGFDANPDSAMVESGRAYAASCGADSIVGLGGGSSLDCAKGINFVLSNGGTMRDYKGHGNVTRPMLAMIGIPTTAGTGSEAQSYAIISDPVTHEKMACGDAQAAFRVAILDPSLTLTQPPMITAIVGYDAISHAVESFVTAKRTPISDLFAANAWRLLESNYEPVLAEPDNVAARGAMLLGAHQAGMAIEQSMLGATHACANPLTARYGTTHGIAISVMLPHVVRWNAWHAAGEVGKRYTELLRIAGRDPGMNPGDELAARLDELALAGGLPRTLRQLGVMSDDLAALAAGAEKQWTGTFNPRPFDAAGALELYQSAY
jgi:alcohol dehydrogenase